MNINDIVLESRVHSKTRCRRSGMTFREVLLNLVLKLTTNNVDFCPI